MPYRAHCDLLPHISGIQNLDVVLEKRFMKYVLSGINHENAVVNLIFNHGVRNFSRIGQNVNFICNKYDIRPNMLSKANIIHAISEKYKNSHRESDCRIGEQVRELAITRDSFDQHLLERSEICDIIEFLTTA